MTDPPKRRKRKKTRGRGGTDAETPSLRSLKMWRWARGSREDFGDEEEEGKEEEEDEESRCPDSVLDEPVDVVLSAMFGGGDLKDIRHAEQSFLSFTVGYHLYKKKRHGEEDFFFVVISGEDAREFVGSPH